MLLLWLLELLPSNPFFDDLPAHDASKIDAYAGDWLTGRSNLDAGNDACCNLIPFNKLIICLEGVFAISEQIMEVSNALAKAFEVAVAS